MGVTFQTSERRPQPGRLRLTLADYYRMGEAGILDRFGRTELIDGEIRVMSPLYLGHARAHTAIYDALRDSIRSALPNLEILFQATTELSADNGPLPDIIVLDRALAADATQGIPGPAVRLIVEVADSTSRFDLGRKRALYATHGVPEYWVALVRKRKIERFAEPHDGVYRMHDAFTFGETVEALTLPGLSLPAGAFDR